VGYRWLFGGGGRPLAPRKESRQLEKPDKGFKTEVAKKEEFQKAEKPGKGLGGGAKVREGNLDLRYEK